MRPYGSSTGAWYTDRKHDLEQPSKKRPRGARQKHKADKAVKARSRQEGKKGEKDVSDASLP